VVRKADRMAEVRIARGRGKPFYAYRFVDALSTLPSPESAGKSGNGDRRDCLAEIAYGTAGVPKGSNVNEAMNLYVCWSD
jgi:hypothetical protein